MLTYTGYCIGKMKGLATNVEAYLSSRHDVLRRNPKFGRAFMSYGPYEGLTISAATLQVTTVKKRKYPIEMTLVVNMGRFMCNTCDRGVPPKAG